MHSGRTPAHRGTHYSDKEQGGLQGHVGKAALSLIHQLLLLLWGRFSCSQGLPRAHCSHIQSCGSSLASGYINPKATGPCRENSYSRPGATTAAGNRQPAYGALHLSMDTYPSPSELGTHQPPLGERGNKIRVLLTASLVTAISAVSLSITAPDIGDALTATGAAPLLVLTQLFLPRAALQGRG